MNATTSPAAGAPTAAPCQLCPEVRRRAAGSSDTWVCGDCGRRYRPRVRVFHDLEPDAPAPDRAPLARAARSARVLTVPEQEAELARVRVVLADLRPDHPDPYAPMPSRAEAERAQTIRVHDPAGAWGGIPRALASPMAGMLARAELATRSGGDVMREVREHGGEAAPVLLWLRREATLAAGLRGLYCDAGGEFASAKQRAAWGLDAEEPTAEHLAARLDGAYAHGRRMVLAAAAAWEQVMRERSVR
jgi:hypothetical protein